MSPDPDPADLTPAERLRGVAAVLARGRTRVRGRVAIPADPIPQEPSGIQASELATPADASATMHAG